MSANSPILLLSGTAPLPDGVGGIILADLCSFLPPGGVCPCSYTALVCRAVELVWQASEIMMEIAVRLLIMSFMAFSMRSTWY